MSPHFYKSLGCAVLGATLTLPFLSFATTTAEVPVSQPVPPAPPLDPGTGPHALGTLEKVGITDEGCHVYRLTTPEGAQTLVVCVNPDGKLVPSIAPTCGQGDE